MPRSIEEVRHTVGSRRLLALLQRQTQAVIAHRAKVSRSCVSLWASAKRVPLPARRELLEAELGIPKTSWTEPTSTALVS